MTVKKNHDKIMKKETEDVSESSCFQSLAIIVLVEIDFQRFPKGTRFRNDDVFSIFQTLPKLIGLCRSSCLEVLCEKNVYKKFEKFTSLLESLF